VLVERAASQGEVHLRQRSVVLAAGRDHQVVDGVRQILEEPLQGRRIRRIEGRCAQRAELGRGGLQSLAMAPGEDDISPLGTCTPGRFESDARATADHDDGLPGQFRFALGGRCAGHDSSAGWARDRSPVLGQAGLVLPFTLTPSTLTPPIIEVHTVSAQLAGPADAARLDATSRLP
jgi:hypothetical protein